MLSINFDHVQKRTLGDRIGLLAGGLDLNGTFFSDTWIDPVSNTVMLRPPPLNADWWTTNTGNTLKYAKSDYTLTTPAKWEEIERHSGAGNWLISQDVNETVILAVALAKNQPIHMAFVPYNSGDNFVMMECGYSDTGDGTNGVSFRLFSGGELEFFVDGTLIDVGSIGGSSTRQSQQITPIELMFIPMRRREILVWTNRGQGVVFVLPDISETDPDPIITDAEKFWWFVPSGTADVQLAKVRFPTSGFVTSLRYFLSEPPFATDVFEKWDNETWAGGLARDYKIDGDEPFVGGAVTASAKLVDPDDGVTVFVPDGVKDECRERVDMTGDGTNTPFIYMAQIGFDRVKANTALAEFDATLFTLAAKLNVPESPSDVSLDLEFKNPEELETFVPKVQVISNRPIVARLEEIVPLDLIDGFGEPPAWSESIDDDARRMIITIRDRWKELENYMFRERVSLDRLSLEEALEFLVRLTGSDTADLDLATSGFVLGQIAPKVCGQANVQIEIGDTAAQWVQDIVEDYAAGFFYGFVPTATGVKFFFQSEADLGDVPELTLYETQADASAAFPAEPLEAVWQHLYHSYRETRLEPESNDIRVTGQDPRTLDAFQTYKADAASQDPTTIPSLRPDNWLGSARRSGLIDPAITTQQLSDDVTDLLFDKQTPQKRLAEWRSTFLLKTDDAPVWRGHVVNLDKKGKYRVQSIACDFVLEDDNSKNAPRLLPPIRSAIYTGIRIEE